MSRPGASGFEREAREVRDRSEKARRGWAKRRANGFEAKPRPPAQRIVGADELERRYRRVCAQLGIRFDLRGFTTFRYTYAGAVGLALAEGRGATRRTYTTNADRARGLKGRGRARCERTVQRTHRRLELAGLYRTAEDRPRGLTRAGRRRKGRLRVWLPPVRLPKDCRVLPTGEQERSLRSAPARGTALDSAGCAGRDRSPPAAPAGNGGDEGEEREARAARPPTQPQLPFGPDWQAKHDELVARWQAIEAEREARGEPQPGQRTEADP